MRRQFRGRGAHLWGDDHKVGRARERRRDAPVKPHSHPDERPHCPRCGAQGTSINKAGRRKKDQVQLWLCFKCRKTFPDQGEVKKKYDPTKCPWCGSDKIEEEPDGTWVCWDCDWFRP